MAECKVQLAKYKELYESLTLGNQNLFNKLKQENESLLKKLKEALEINQKEPKVAQLISQFNVYFIIIFIRKYADALVLKDLN